MNSAIRMMTASHSISFKSARILMSLVFSESCLSCHTLCERVSSGKIISTTSQPFLLRMRKQIIFNKNGLLAWLALRSFGHGSPPVCGKFCTSSCTPVSQCTNLTPISSFTPSKPFEIFAILLQSFCNPFGILLTSFCNPLAIILAFFRNHFANPFDILSQSF